MATRQFNFRCFTGITVTIRLYTFSSAEEIYEAPATELEGTDGEMLGRYTADIVNVPSGTYDWIAFNDEDEPLNSGIIDHQNSTGVERDRNETETPAETSSESPTVDTSDAILELALSPRKVVTDEGTVEERPIKEVIEADKYASAKEAASAPLFGLRIARFKPAGPA